ncbi:MAG: hypothetical protein FJZ90_02840 [Chloroflexi bacterium]|nr:hypothetical protein [Chloroflexota bacterium]
MRARQVWIVIALLAALAACEGSAPGTGARSITTRKVRITPNQAITVSGEGRLAEGDCVRTELLAGQTPVAWWPADCATLKGSTWEVIVPLGQSETPGALATDTEYTIRAWLEADSQVQSEPFVFDLAPPPSDTPSSR